MALSPGTIVYLASGSPAMTVLKSNEDGVVTQWFVGVGYQSNTFPEASLVTIDPTITLAHAREKAKAALELSDPLPVKE